MPEKLGRGDLPISKREAFKLDVEGGMKDPELAKRYKMSERTATNWRVRLCGKRPKKSPPA